MNAVLEQINSAGDWFVGYAVPMLVQSSVLIAVLLLADLVLRRKVRAVFRYWLWMLVLVKLILPISLSSPVSVGCWFGDELASVKLSEAEVAAEAASLPEMSGAEPVEEVSKPALVSPQEDVKRIAIPTAGSGPMVSAAVVTWEGVVFLVWVFVVVVMGLLLLQRAIFVNGLVGQSKEAGGLMGDVLKYCCKCIGFRGKVGLKVSVNAASPAVCGLFRPVILVPQDLGGSLGAGGLRAVLLHELAHIKRGDLWVNLIQTLLQIVYFYNPLLWFANAMIRRVREEAVDEMVQVAMGEKAREYPETLVNVARQVFRRPALSLRLIGVVESKSTLKGRVRRMLSRPIPRSAKLGMLGLAVIVFVGCVLLPMAKAAVGPPEFVIKGTVTDAETGQPVAGAKVGDVERYAEGKQWTTTDTDGSYSYLTWYEEHGVKAEADGYKRQDKGFGTKLFGSEKGEIINFALEREEAARQTEFAATLAGGVTVELVGVCDYPDGGKRCWRPDGSIPEKQIFVKRERDYSNGKYGFILKVAGPEDLSFCWNNIEGGGYWGSCTVTDSTGNNLDGFQAAVTKDYNGRDTTNIRVGIATGPWQTKISHDGKSMCIKGNVAFSSAYESDGSVRIIVTDDFGNDVVHRVVAIDTDGEIHTWGGRYGSVSNSSMRQTTASFPGLKLNQIVEFEFQTRPYEWVEFKNVSLKPNFKTDVQIEAQNPSGQVISASDFGKDEVGVEKRRAKLRVAFERRMARDRAAYSDRELGEIEQLYQIANKKWKSQEARDSLEKLVARYARANRTGCAVLYLGQMSGGAQKERYLKRAIEDFGDCMYGDGVRVGAFARYLLAMHYEETGKKDEAKGLIAELIKGYPDAVGHDGKFLIEQIPDDLKDAAGVGLNREDKSRNDADRREPVVVRTFPSAFSNNVSPALTAIKVTFDRPMMDRSWSWTGGGKTYPQTPGRPYYDISRTTCTLPVKLEAGKVYWVGINSPSHKNFKAIERIPAKRYVILFATRGADGKPTPIPEDMLAKAKVINEQAGTGETKQINSSREQDNSAVSAGPADLQQLIDSARPGGTITIPKGVYTGPIEIDKPLILEGESPADCVFEITANEPAIFVDTKGKGRVTIEGITVKWQLSTSDKNIGYPFAVAVKDTRVKVKNCNFLPLGNFKRCPTAIQAVGFSELLIDGCRLDGFEYTVCYGEGTKGTIQDCVITASGHQGISLYEDAKVRIERNIVAGSKYHGVRSTGGTLFMKDNLIINNDNRGVYLGNKSARGTISNNVIIGNECGISGFGRSQVKIENNIISDSSYAGIQMVESSKLAISNNIIRSSERGLLLSGEGVGNDNSVLKNTFWKNKVDAEGLEKPANSISAEPVFADAGNGDFSLTGGKPLDEKQGLTNPQILKALWERWYSHTTENKQVGGTTQADVQVEGTAQPMAEAAKLEKVNQNPIGKWRSVDLVLEIEDFEPGVKSFSGELFLKDVEFKNGGRTSSSFTWRMGWIRHQDGRTKARYQIKKMNGMSYLFLPWLSGDVTIRGEKPWYYVMEEVVGKAAQNEREQIVEQGGPTVLAREFVGLLVKEEFSAATRNFDATMRQAMPPERLADVWKGLVGQSGAFKEEVGVRTERMPGFDIVYVTCEFEKGPLDIKVVYDSERQVSGLWFVPVPQDVLEGYRNKQKIGDEADVEVEG